MREGEEPKPGADASRALMSAMFSAGAAASAGGSFGVAATAGAAGATFDLAVGLRDKWTERRSKSALEALKQAGDIVGGLDILNERAQADDERIELAAKVCEAAAQTTMPAKIRALARVLADGVGPGGDVDEATVLALALRDLEGSHIQVLRTVEKAPTPAPRPIPSPAKWKLADLRMASDVRVFDAVLSVLVRHGLITDRHDVNTWDTTEASRWGITEVGLRCLVLLGHEVSPTRT